MKISTLFASIFLFANIFACSNIINNRRRSVDIESDTSNFDASRENNELLRLNLIPKVQLDAGWDINLYISFISLIWNYKNEFFAQIGLAYSLIKIYKSLQLFIGYKINIIFDNINNDSIISLMPKLQLERLEFRRETEFVDYNRWICCTLAWIVQILMAFSDEISQILNLNLERQVFRFLMILYAILFMNMAGIINFRL